MEYYISDSDADSLGISSDHTFIDHELDDPNESVDLTPVELIAQVAKDKSQTLFKIITILYDNYGGLQKPERHEIGQTMKSELSNEGIPKQRLRLVNLILRNFME